MTIKLKRVYEPPAAGDGYRILVDRLWPRGVSKADAAADLWLQRIAPSDALRAWYGHEPERWPEFEERYRAELAGHAELLDLIGDIERHEKTVTLVYGAKDEERNQATVIAAVLKEREA